MNCHSEWSSIDNLFKFGNSNLIEYSKSKRFVKGGNNQIIMLSDQSGKLNYINQSQDRRLEKIEEHIEIINGELGEIKENTTKLCADLQWVKRISILLLTSMLGLIGIVLSRF